MKSITFNSIRTELRDWIDNRLSPLPNFGLPFFSHGGWEGWLQVEWAMFFTANDYDVIRESYVYDGALRADLVFNSTIQRGQEIILEIKCQSIYVKTDVLYKSIIEDENKLRGLNNGQKGVMCVVVVSQELYSKLQENGYSEIYSRNKEMALMYKIVK
ncbi:MAG: hypothetical protein ACI3YT_07610 [Prevotella sp.]